MTRATFENAIWTRFRLWLVSLCCVALTVAIVHIPPAHAGETFRSFLDALWPEAEALGVTRATFDTAFKGVEPDYTIPDLVKPGEEPVPEKRAEPGVKRDE